MAQQGQAASYYNNDQPSYQQQSQYNQQQQQQQRYQDQNYQQSQTQQPYQQQNYPQAVPPQNGYSDKTSDPSPYGNGFNPPMSQDQTFQETFKLDKPKWNDLWAALLLLATFLGFTAVSGLTLYKYSRYHRFNGQGIYNSNNDFSLNTNTIVLFAFVLAVAFVFSWAYLLLARFFTKQFIWITGILNICFAVGSAAYYLYRHLWGAGIVFAILALFTIFCFISWIPRIPFAVVMLQQSQDIAQMKRVHVYTVSAIGSLVSLAFAAWFSVTLTAIYTSYMPSNSGARANPSCAQGGCSSGRVIGLIVFITFAGYWITEWIKNTVHTVIAGNYGSWYFCAGKPGGIPRGAALGAFKRAMTYSVGSVSFGSLIVALIDTLRWICSIARAESAQDGNIIGTIFFCILGFLISFLDWLVQFFNRFAFAHIALYGKAYVPAAKDTWSMMKDRGLDGLVNDCLVSPVLSMGSTFVGLSCALLSYLYLEFTDPAYNQGRTFTPVIMAFSFLIGMQVCQILTTPIKSGIDTIFVAMGWDPAVAYQEHPEFWNKLVQVYPRVQQVIHV